MKIRFKCRIKTLTPLHVGSGKNYIRGADFDLKNNLLTVIDSHRLQQTIEKAGEKVQKRYMEELQKEKSNLHDFFKDVGWKISEFKRYTLPLDTHFLWEIKGHIKDGFGRPLIPGSSLKGGLRTALFAYLIKNEADPQRVQQLLNAAAADRKARHPAKDIERYVFGPDAQKNWMRIVQAPDVAFNVEDLQLFQVKILSKTSDGYGFKQLGKMRRTLPANQVKQATSIVVEALSAGVESPEMSLNLDGYLLRQQHFRPTALEWPDANQFWSIVNSHFVELAKREARFFEGVGFSEVAHFYDRVILKEKRAANEVLMRISWGGGWHFMTGDWLSEAQKERLRPIIGIRRYVAVEDFPKTRRLAVEGGRPLLPLGWIVLRVQDG